MSKLTELGIKGINNWLIEESIILLLFESAFRENRTMAKPDPKLKPVAEHADSVLSCGPASETDFESASGAASRWANADKQSSRQNFVTCTPAASLRVRGSSKMRSAGWPLRRAVHLINSIKWGNALRRGPTIRTLRAALLGQRL